MGWDVFADGLVGAVEAEGRTEGVRLVEEEVIVFEELGT